MAMFGDLFKEEEQNTHTSIPQRTGKVCEPPPPRGKLKLSGIRNQGSTCYLNSLLQTLLYTPEFREELFSLGPDELGKLEDKDKPDAKVRVIPLELQNLFARLLLLDEQTITTTALTDSFGWTNSEEMTQQDVQELNRILFSALESSLVGTSGSSLIQRLYHGTLINSITCNECHNVSERQEDFLDLTVSVGGVSSLEEALWNMFVEEEVFDENNLYCCSNCYRLVQATKSARLQTLPPFLSVSLMRFSFDCVKCERFKETRRYSFPLSINLQPYCKQSDQPDSELSYELYSVIIHKGGCYGGHYHAYIKDIDQLGHWELPEDDGKQKKQKVQVKPVSVCVYDSAVEDPLSLLTAVLSEESGSVLVDQLGQKLMEKIGCSWNNKFRKQYGPIRKFLQSNPDVFLLLVNGSRVALRNSAETPEQEAEPKSVSDSAVDEREAGPDSGVEAEPVSGHWFDLNDSSVTAIRKSDIIKQYEGKESAYMLFYRKCTLQRPPHALGNPAFGVPAHLLQMVQEENSNLHQRRTEFEVSSNSIDVQLHLASHYCIENGALTLIDTHMGTQTLTLSIDRRRTVGDLRLAVYQMQDAWEGDMALTIAKYLPAGLHLYDTLTDDHQSLYSCGVYNGTNLFVWNGTEVNGVCAQTGAEYEPLLLNIMRPVGAEPDSVGVASNETVSDALKADASGLVHEKRGFSGGVTLGGVREALSLQEGLVCQQTEGVGPSGEGGGASRWKVCSAQAMRRTLRELALRDGDTLLLLPHTHLDDSLFSVNDDVVTVMTPSDCRWLQVEFHTHTHTHTTQEEEEERKLMKIPAAGSTLVSEVKQRALEEMQLQKHFTSGVCLRERDRTGKLLPPVCEDLTVRDAGIKLMTSLCLCPGHAPTSSQLFLYFSVMPLTGPELEIIVEKTLTVKECLMVMLQKAGLDGTCWHLRRMDWCEEVGEPLMDENTFLLDLGVVNGDTLVITEGQLPPKGFLRLTVRQFMATSDECERNHTAESHTTEMQSVGCIDISEEASLHEFKCQVLTLPALVQVCVPSPEFLRVWLVEGKKLIRILRGNQFSLRKLKLSLGSEVCVQKLQYEENLGLKDILLRLLVATEEGMGVSETSAYFPTHEFVWEAELDSSPRGLYHAVSTHCGISPGSLLLAKHLPEQHTWITINYGIQPVSKQKKKQNKSNSKALNLQGAPYYLRDGDTIAVKNLLTDSNRGFATVKNDYTLGEQSSKKKNRKAEVALSINVDVFR